MLCDHNYSLRRLGTFYDDLKWKLMVSIDLPGALQSGDCL